MPRVGQAYFVRPDNTAHDTATSTGTANKQTLVKPAGATGMFLSATTTNARCTFSGEDPVASSLGLVIVAGGAPVYFPFASDIEFVSEAAANSVLSVLWLE